jgi:hypothetical protein
MILVIGSRASGKREYVKSLGYTERHGGRGFGRVPRDHNVQDMVEADPEGSLSLLPALLQRKSSSAARWARASYRRSAGSVNRARPRGGCASALAKEASAWCDL